jgi:hypothetical protein
MYVIFTVADEVYMDNALHAESWARQCRERLTGRSNFVVCPVFPGKGESVQELAKRLEAEFTLQDGIIGCLILDVIYYDNAFAGVELVDEIVKMDSAFSRVIDHVFFVTKVVERRDEIVDRMSKMAWSKYTVHSAVARRPLADVWDRVAELVGN